MCITSLATPYVPNAAGGCTGTDSYTVKPDPHWPLVAGLGVLSNFIPALAATPQPTATATFTQTATATSTPTNTTIPASCGIYTCTTTPTNTITPTGTATGTATNTSSPTNTVSPTPRTGGAVIPLGNIPSLYANHQITVGMFDPGDVVNCTHQGFAWMELLRPDGTISPFTYTITSDSGTGYATDAPGDRLHNSTDDNTTSATTGTTISYSGNPPGPIHNAPIVVGTTRYGNADPANHNNPAILVAAGTQKLYSNSWVYITFQVPSSYVEGYWKLQYVLEGNTLPADRLTITLTAKDAPVSLLK